MKILTYIWISAVILLGVSCSSCKNSNKSSETGVEKEILNPYDALAKSKKLPRGSVLVNLEYEKEEFNSASEYLNVQVTKVLRRGQEAPVISNDEKISIGFTVKQKDSLRNINNDSEVLIKVSRDGKNNTDKQIWQIISIK